ncbi:MAG: hypothetical protein ABW223_04035 [Rariglobus sp.]
MTTQIISSQSLFRGLLAMVSSVALLASAATAVTIPVPNGDFSLSTNNGSEGGLLISSYTNKQLGSFGPWRATGEGFGVLGIVGVIAPVVNISGGDVSFGSLVGVTPLIRNEAWVFNNDIGADFVTGTTYLLKADFTTNALVDINVLKAAGFGISLRSSGTDVANSITNVNDPLLTAFVFGNKAGSISLTYTHLGASGSDIGVSMFAGQGSGLISLGLFNQVTFDNVTLTAVPEPSAWAAWGGAVSLMTAFVVRRKRRTPAGDV